MSINKRLKRWVGLASLIVATISFIGGIHLALGAHGRVASGVRRVPPDDPMDKVYAIRTAVYEAIHGPFRGCNLYPFRQMEFMTFNNELEVYMIFHNDNAPSMAMMRDWQWATEWTDEEGNIVPSGTPGAFAPIRDRPWPNELTGKTHVALTGYATSEDGWTFDPTTKKLRAVLRVRPWYVNKDDCEMPN